MKAFIVLALVAVAAARSVDVSDLLKEKSLLSRDDLLLNKIGTNHRFGGLNTPTWSKKVGSFYPSVYNYGDDDVESTYYNRRVTILSYEEMVATPLFREYYQVPMFRQFLEQYPVVFRRYVESPLFQQFWTQPQFVQYFRNPVLFYKYIVPQIQIVSQSEGTYPYNYEHQGYNYQGQDVTRDVNVGDYLTKIFGQSGSQYNREYSHTPFYPYAATYGQRYGTQYTPVFGHQGRDSVFGRQGLESVFGRHHNVNNVNNVNYKFLLDKIYRTLFVDQPTVGEVTDVTTDVKVAPAHKEVVVEPITGETKVIYEKPKIVDVKVAEKTVPRSEIESTSTYTTEENEIVKETILKRLLVNKRISIQLYTILKTLPLHHVKEIVRRIVSHPLVGGVESVYGDDYDYTYPTGYNNYHNVDVNDVNDVTYRQRINNILSPLYTRDIVGDRYDPVVRDLLKTFGHHQVRDVPSVEDIFRH